MIRNKSFTKRFKIKLQIWPSKERKQKEECKEWLKQTNDLNKSQNRLNCENKN